MTKGISIRLSDEIRSKAKKFANQEPLAQYLRKLIAQGLAVAEYKEQNPEPKQDVTNTNLIHPKKPERLAEFNRNFEFFMLEISALLQLIIKDSGKFEPEKAKDLLSKAQYQVEVYMRLFEQGWTKEEEVKK